MRIVNGETGIVNRETGKFLSPKYYSAYLGLSLLKSV